ncbi:MAG: hypothetical protein IJZ15_07245 [Oscillospiraceae bacterium]|nr:hypothetical protein [Oscillospiraceae bacterium]
MKVFGIIVKIVVALAAVAGAVYVAATYGDKIVAWAKKTLGACKCCCDGECECDCDCDCDCTEDVTVEEAVEAAEETDVIAAETDFEG